MIQNLHSAVTIAKEATGNQRFYLKTAKRIIDEAKIPYFTLNDEYLIHTDQIEAFKAAVIAARAPKAKPVRNASIDPALMEAVTAQAGEISKLKELVAQLAIDLEAMRQHINRQDPTRPLVVPFNPAIVRPRRPRVLILGMFGDQFAQLQEELPMYDLRHIGEKANAIAPSSLPAVERVVVYTKGVRHALVDIAKRVYAKDRIIYCNGALETVKDLILEHVPATPVAA